MPKKDKPFKANGSRLKNYNHEKFSQRVAESILTPGKPVNQTAIYNEVYGVTKDVASSGGSALIAKPEIRTRVQELLDANGMSLEHLTKKLEKLQASKKPIYFEGKKIDEIEDTDIQMKATKLGFELQRAMPNQIESQTNSIHLDARSINLELGDSKNIEKLALIAESFKDLFSSAANKTGLVKNSTAPKIEEAEFRIEPQQADGE